MVPTNDTNLLLKGNQVGSSQQKNSIHTKTRLTTPGGENNILNNKMLLNTQFKADLLSLQQRLDLNRSIQTPTTTITGDNAI